MSYLLHHCEGVSPKQSGKINIVNFVRNKELNSGLLPASYLAVAMTINKVNIRHCEPLQAAKQSRETQTHNGNAL
ncbi:MAG: hypothetical protein FWD66_10080 [Paludibacter sp.]|nr:hypothetical protein [Paludibacter sp.]